MRLLLRFCRLCLLTWFIVALSSSSAWGKIRSKPAGKQKPATAASKKEAASNDKPTPPPRAEIVIPLEPRAIAPTTLHPAKLLTPLSVDFNEVTLDEIVKWFQNETKINFVLDQRELSQVGILPSESLITESASKLPLYLLLDRLQTAEIGWYFQDDLIHLTSQGAAEEKLRTVNYIVGDLLDAGYKSDALLELLTSVVRPNSWKDRGGPGSIIALGDVLFVSQSQECHREVTGLLAALRKHGRRTYTLDAAEHDPLRTALARTVSLEVHDLPLSAVIQQLAKQVSADIKIDRKGIDEFGIEERTPVSMSVSEQTLSITLTLLLEKFGLSWCLRDGALWITNPDAECLKTAVYDVRDLCRDVDEAVALQEAITSQLSANNWDEVGGRGVIEFPLSGAMVVSQTERIHDQLLELLENYRAALRISKPRQQPGKDRKEIVTHYYRMPETMANDLVTALPKLLKPESWQGENHPDAIGTITKLASQPEQKIQTQTTAKKEESTVTSYVLIPHSVLVIKHQREIHAEIPRLLEKLQYGDPYRDGRGRGVICTSSVPVVGGDGTLSAIGGGG